MHARLIRCLICFVVVATIILVWFPTKFWAEPRAEGVPYGVSYIGQTQDFGTQDFAMHLDYVRQIAEKAVAHPYRLEDQETMAHQWYGLMASGMPHAYSPVALVMALPLLRVSPEMAYDIATVVNGLLLVLLTFFYLVPRLKNPVQVCAVLASFFGYVLFDLFFMGQTALVTTCLLAFGYVLLQGRSARTGRALLAVDGLLGVVLYLLAIKPSVALIFVVMLLGERAWQALVFAGLLLLLTWGLVADYYGGVWSGLVDYFWLLNHYCQADMTSFFRPGLAPGISTNFNSCVTVLMPAWNGPAFVASRMLFNGLLLGLLVARWLQRISLSVQFQGLLWTFLLFCPHLLVTEDFVICLLAVEGNFFRPDLGAGFKILLVFLLVNTCMGLSTTVPIFFPVKLALAFWWLIDLIVCSRKGTLQKANFSSPSS